jgi:hypothetical protein
MLSIAIPDILSGREEGLELLKSWGERPVRVCKGMLTNGTEVDGRSEE